ncbi:GGDEF domain-containing response regulator [Alteromonas sp. D210916BOD_24]|uniref:GGDEF domain-containing response regulator n=1 Tax=Alteromonas sp. D210916BOD_24 TaxID=3157618 RepID=UPI00399D29F5
MFTNTKPQKYSVLIVEDDALMRSTIIAMLCKEFECNYADDGQMAIEFCQRHGKPDVILMDYHMPEINGLQTCIKLQEYSELKNVPVIFFTGNDDSEVQEQCWRAGAADFVTKPVRAEVLKMRILRQIGVKQKEVYLENLACKDQLTSLYNRQFLSMHVPRLVKQLNREKEPLAVVMIDVDDFKKFNDSYGHLEGDKVLKAVAKSLKNTARRPMDFVFRFGGEEFVVLLPKTRLSGANLIAKKMLKGVEALNIKNKHSDYGKVTISAGVISSENQGALKFVDMLKKADEALYESKSLGKNTVSISAAPKNVARTTANVTFHVAS